MVAPYQVFPTRDGELMVAAGNDRIFAALCRALERPELVEDTRFRTNPDRVRHREELAEILTDLLRMEAASVWRERLAAAGVPVAPVADVRDVAESPQTEALGILQPLDHPVIPDLRLPAQPVSFDGERALHGAAPPLVGQHSAEVLREAGYSSDEITALAAEGVIRT